MRKELERAVLGAILSDREVFYQNMTKLSLIEFTSLRSEIWGIIWERLIEGKNVDALIISETNERLEDEVMECLGSRFVGIFQEHIEKLREITIRDKQKLLARWIDEQVKGKKDVNKLTSNILDKAIDLMDSASKEVKTPAEHIQEVKESIELNQGGELTGMPTGLTDFDKSTKGLRPGDLHILAGRPGMGKTAFALTIALKMAKRGYRVGVAELEMSNNQLWSRLIANHMNVTLDELQSGRIEIETKEMANFQLYTVDDHFDLTEVEGFARKQKAMNRLDVLFIDYLQLISGVEGESLNVRTGNISRRMKLLAKSLEIPIILLCQLSRACETRGGDCRPKLSDLRDSGSIEQDADLVYFVYRPEYYGFTETDGGLPTNNVAYIIKAKDRHGKTEEIELEFIGYKTTFKDANRAGDEPFSPFK